MSYEARSSQSPPTLYEWAGGMSAFERLTQLLYDRIEDEPLLAPLFANADPHHRAHVARFIAEVFGGPRTYSEDHGGHPAMIEHHVGKGISEEQRRRWVQLIGECADAAGLPDPNSAQRSSPISNGDRAWPC